MTTEASREAQTPPAATGAQATEQVQEQTIQPEPVYITQEELDRRMGTERLRWERHFQSVADKQIAQANERAGKLQQQLNDLTRQQEENYLAGLPDEERPAKMAELAYKRTRAIEEERRQPAAVPVQQAAPESDANVIELVQQAALPLAEQLGVNYYDMRLWQGMDLGNSVQENLRIFRDNAARLNPQAARTVQPPNTTQPAPATQARRQPQSVPARNTPAASTTAPTDEEIEDAIIKNPTDRVAQRNYAAMRRRWTEA